MGVRVNSDLDECLFIFYGLLQNGASGAPDDIPLSTAGEWLGPCRFRATLFDAGGYPGVREGEGLCDGVLYRLHDVSILPALDAFEDCNMADPDSSLYQRRQVTFFDGPQGFDSGRASIYWYCAPSKHFPVISSGKWPLDGRWREVGERE